MRVHVINGVEVIERGPEESGDDAEQVGTPGRPVVVYMPLAHADSCVANGAFDCIGVRGDAYASSVDGLYEALGFAAGEDRAARAIGPLRLVWLGSLGSDEPRTVGPLGRAFPIAGTVNVGRSPDSGIVLRCGPHSDQNLVARRHAILERIGDAVHVRDLQSTQGTWINAVRIESAVLAPGDEIAFAGVHRFRLDGGRVT